MYRAAVDSLATELGAAGIESPRMEAERLVSMAVGLRRHELFLNADRRIEPVETTTLKGLVRRRVAGEPLQYIEGLAAFRELELKVDSAVLVPRPETEQLVDHVASWIQHEKGGRPVERALDVGTGSGAVSLALATEHLVRSLVSLDLSESALAVAAINVRALDLTDRIQLRHCGPDFWEAIVPEERFGLIVSNPPYVTDSELDNLPDEVRRHEPRVALAGGPDGLDIIRRLSAGAPDRLEPGGALFVEIGARQGSVVTSLLEADHRWREVRLCQDLCGRDRFAVGVRR